MERIFAESPSVQRFFLLRSSTQCVRPDKRSASLVISTKVMHDHQVVPPVRDEPPPVVVDAHAPDPHLVTAESVKRRWSRPEFCDADHAVVSRRDQYPARPRRKGQDGALVTRLDLLYRARLEDRLLVRLHSSLFVVGGGRHGRRESLPTDLLRIYLPVSTAHDQTVRQVALGEGPGGRKRDGPRVELRPSRRRERKRIPARDQAAATAAAPPLHRSLVRDGVKTRVAVRVRSRDQVQIFGEIKSEYRRGALGRLDRRPGRQDAHLHDVSVERLGKGHDAKQPVLSS
mmetsp:Transcript_26121/g.62075  ORF Transcript_26121/g.62075 Transcript_26121/m.62075 type:complete len:287 (-) Transcript_26121:1086-1946(-)